MYEKARNVSELAGLLTGTTSWDHYLLNCLTNQDYINRHDARTEVILTLAVIPPRVIEAIIEGGLHEKVVSDRKCRKWLRQDTTNHHSEHLAIYANTIVTADGIHPTIRETRCILDQMRRYVKGEDATQLNRVDTRINRGDWRQVRGFEKWRYIDSDHAKGVISRLITKVKLRCEISGLNGDDINNE